MSKCNDKTTNPSILIDVNDMVSHNIDFDCCENNKNVVLDSQNLSSIGRFLSETTTIKKIHNVDINSINDNFILAI